MSESVAEFIGTMILVLLGDGVVANVCLKGTKGCGGGWIVITMGWGLGVFTGVMIAEQFSGAHLNPAVTLGLAAAGRFAVAKVPVFLIAQFFGAAAGALLVWLFYKDHYDISTDPGAILGALLAAWISQRAAARPTERIVPGVHGGPGRTFSEAWEP